MCIRSLPAQEICCPPENPFCCAEPTDSINIGVVNFLMRARTFNASIALAVSALFVLALVSAQPHRVHHFFQEIEHAHGQGEADSNHAGHSQAPAKTP